MLLVGVAAVAAVAAGCSDATSDSSTSTVPATPTTDLIRVPAGLESFETASITVEFPDSDRELLVAIADDAAERARGLMNVTDLLDLDGMLFVFDGDTEGGFWMRDTLLPLTIVHFDGAGTFVSTVDMEPCTTAECPSYFADGPYRFALEIPQGAFDTLPLALTFD